MAVLGGGCYVCTQSCLIGRRAQAYRGLVYRPILIEIHGDLRELLGEI